MSLNSNATSAYWLPPRPLWGGEAEKPILDTTPHLRNADVVRSNMLHRLFRNKKGQGLVEYGLIIAGVAAPAVWRLLKRS